MTQTQTQTGWRTMVALASFFYPDPNRLAQERWLSLPHIALRYSLADVGLLKSHLFEMLNEL